MKGASERDYGIPNINTKILIVVKKTATIPEGTEIINLLSTDVDFSYSIFANLFPLFFSLFSY